eukprot:TRINITY_DN12522_c0_g1_i1.p1 TRINITY_DN12522_c0_g1~~TRINITY_DN12522_c0_g1_i1.p1  ORF type:complete len:166 (+),score=19.35 TRINITY_DN12522_c0_g1_i1:139-636(+)
MSLAIVIGIGSGITATALDSEDTVRSKYPSSCCVDECRRLGVKVLFGVDATKMSHDLRVNDAQYHCIMFNFPHTGHPQTSGAQELKTSIEANRLLLSSFFIQARCLVLLDGEIQVTLKDRYPYREWDVHALAKERYLELTSIVPFCPDNWPGYIHVATLKKWPAR